MRYSTRYVRAAGFLLALAFALPGWAGPDTRPNAGSGSTSDADARVAAARALFQPEHAIGNSAAHTASGGDVALDSQRGGAATRNDMRLDGAVSANTAVNVVSGTNSIDAGSFANMSGIPVVIQNSGANVLIQNATIINLQFK